MAIRIRNDFHDIPMEVAYLTYEVYDRAPSCEDYVYGKVDNITLRNKDTGELEQITYRLIGAIPYIYHSGYQSFWGEIDSNDRYCCLVFDFRLDGSLEKITASFCVKSPTTSQLKQMSRDITYAAEAFTICDFYSKPF